MEKNTVKKSAEDTIALIALCIREGRTLQMTSSEILEGVCATLEDAGIDITSPVDIDD